MDLFSQIEALQKEHGSRPPVDKWNPALSGDIDIRIAHDGRWFHEGDEIRRLPLVKLFASILKREGDDYFLVTPVEKWRIQVEDAPLVVVDFSRRGKGEAQQLAFKTNTDDIVVADEDHPIKLQKRGEGGVDQLLPYLIVRDNLPARINRNVYYHLVDMALAEGGDEAVMVRSCGCSFPLA